MAITVGTPLRGANTYREEFTVDTVVNPFVVSLEGGTPLQGIVRVTYQKKGSTTYTTIFNGTHQVSGDVATSLGWYDENDNAKILAPDDAIYFIDGLVDANTVTINELLEVGSTVTIDYLPSNFYKTESYNFAGDDFTLGSNTLRYLSWWVLTGDPISYSGSSIFKPIYVYEINAGGDLYRYNASIKYYTPNNGYMTLIHDKTNPLLIGSFDASGVLVFDTGRTTSDVTAPVGAFAGVDVFVQTQTLTIGGQNVEEPLPVDPNGATGTTRIYQALDVIPNANYDKSTFYFTAKKDSDGSLITAVSDVNGVVTGAGITSGTLDDRYVLDITFDSAIRLSEDCAWTMDYISQDSVPFDNTGVEPYLVPENGEVEIFKPYNYAVVHNTQSIQVNGQVNNQTVDCTRSVDFIDIVDSNGARLYTPENTYYTVNYDTGIVTLLGDWSAAGFVAPYYLSHQISETVMIDTVDYATNTVKFLNALQNSYPADNTYVSNALMLGDLQATATVLGDILTWDSITWEDTLTGTQATASYDDTNYPIEVVNDGAVDQRWALKFTSGTTYEVVGETVGVVATGDIDNDLVVSIGGKVAMTIRQLGFGGGWQSGNAIRINTKAADNGVWLLRTIDSTTANITNYDVRLQIRGNIQ